MVKNNGKVILAFPILILKTMRLNCKISSRLILNISSLYTDSNRVFMEHINNSLYTKKKENRLLSSMTGDDAEYKNKLVNSDDAIVSETTNL